MPTDTFPIAFATDDGDAYRKDTVWANITTATFTANDGTPASMFKSLFASDYYCGNLYFRFDTSSIPDTATVTGAALQLYCSDKADPNSVVYAADFYTFAGEPSTTADWEQTSSGNAISSITSGLFTIGVVATIPLTGLSGINLSGITGIRIAPSTTTAPTGDNYIETSTFESATQEPRLEVTYTTGAAATYTIDVQNTTPLTWRT